MTHNEEVTHDDSLETELLGMTHYEPLETDAFQVISSKPDASARDHLNPGGSARRLFFSDAWKQQLQPQMASAPLARHVRSVKTSGYLK